MSAATLQRYLSGLIVMLSVASLGLMRSYPTVAGGIMFAVVCIACAKVVMEPLE